MGASQSSSSVGRKDKLHKLNLASNRVSFRANRNKEDDSDYDDEEDSVVEQQDDEKSSEDDQIKDKDGADKMFDDIPGRPEGDER